jgi:hypothetical protein
MKINLNIMSKQINKRSTHWKTYITKKKKILLSLQLLLSLARKTFI